MFSSSIGTCDDTLLGIRDRALIAFCFCHGGRTQLAATTVTNAQGQLSCIVWRDPSRPQLDRSITVDVRVAGYVDAWLTASGIRSGPIWRRIQHGRVTTGSSPQGFYKIIARRAQQAGLTGITGRSFRAGFVVAATEKEMPIRTVKWLSGHHSNEPVWRYQRRVTLESMLRASEVMQR
jgi:integrase